MPQPVVAPQSFVPPAPAFTGYAAPAPAAPSPLAGMGKEQQEALLKAALTITPEALAQLQPAQREAVMAIRRLVGQA